MVFGRSRSGWAVVGAAWTLVVCGQWATCTVRSRARGGCPFSGVGRGRLDFGRMWSVGDVLCPKSRAGGVLSRGGPWSPGLWSYVVSG